MSGTSVGKNEQGSLKWIALTLCLLLSSLPTLVQAEPSDPLFAIIVHPDVETFRITPAQLRAIYTLRTTRWPDDTPILVHTLAQQSSAHQKFVKSELQLLAHQLQTLWYRITFTGMGRGPTEVQDVDSMVEAVASTPGAIGYLPVAAWRLVGASGKVRSLDHSD